VGNINLVVDKMRVDQSRVRLAEVEIGDETGTVSLRARDEQIDLLEKVRGKGIPRAVVLRNCTLELYQGKHIRLAVTKWGKLTEYPDNVASTPGPPPTMNLDRNFSFIDLSLVASEIIPEKKQPDAPPYASVTTALTGSRQTKKAEVKTNKPAASSAKPSATPTKQGQSNIKQQQQQLQQQQQQQASRRTSQSSTNEQRRQSRSSQYGGMQVDTTQPSRSGQMMYHRIPEYHGYGEQSMDMHMRQQYPPHSPYAHSHMHSQSSRQQDAVSAQYALHQQYEMQQRQLHQLYTLEQSRQVGQVHQQQQQQQPSQMHLRHMTSFDTSTGSYAGDISMSSEIGSSQSMVPPPDHYSQSPKMENYPGLQQDVTQSTAAYASMEAMSQYRIGKMNPEASSFAPSYLSAAQQGSSNQQQMTTMAIPQYPAYNISQQQQQQQQPLPGASMYPTLQSAHHPQFYMQAAISPAVYLHTMPQGSFNTSLERDPDVKPESTATASTTSRSHHHYQQYPPNAPPTKASAPSTGKENVTSKP
jgi:hypothetical protein